MKRSPSPVVGAVTLIALMFVVSACGSSSKASSDATTTTPATETSVPANAGGPLVGLFKIAAADCVSGAPTGGSYFRMATSTGTVAAGPFVPDADSTCGDKTYVGLTPGTDGGLKTNAYQPQPDPAFDATHNGLADKITQPAKFTGVGFAVSTNAKDPQTGKSEATPSITADATGKLSGDLGAVGVAWNGQQFNQGATATIHGTYNKSTSAFELEWSSKISGGPFNGFTGIWHLEGTFEKS